MSDLPFKKGDLAMEFGLLPAFSETASIVIVLKVNKHRYDDGGNFICSALMFRFSSRTFFSTNLTTLCDLNLRK